MSDDTVTIEVDGEPVTARKGQMIIEATDAIGTYIPRFCYHEKLSIAANCRMCLIEAEMGGRPAPKPLPACATPVADGMKVFTRSPKAIAAQRATMEFLLINHPLDCPICDQGGECELQDLAIGYGRDISRYNDGKRVVKDKDIGPLVSTDMTRCIHCTRCVRFGEEVSGMQQLGTTERGENMKIGTFVEKSVDHELSANIIDLCPVGALNNKPYRYSARAWEMTQIPAVSPHDCVGSNLYAHVLRGTVKRVVPRDNEAINETWISDRDRFSYEAIYSSDRLQAPRIKESGTWRDASWDEALEALADAMKSAGENSGLLLSPSSTVEEGYLATAIAQQLGTSNIDHRIRQRDFSDQGNDAVFPYLGCSIADIEQQNAIFVVGSNVRAEAPIIAHRIRKAAVGGASVSFANSAEHDYYFDVHASLSGAGLVEMLAGVASATGAAPTGSVQALCSGVQPSDEQRGIADSLKAADNGLVLLGNIAMRHEACSAVRALCAFIAEATGTDLGMLSEGSNAAGLSQVGVLPHRGAAGESRDVSGDTADKIASGTLDAIVLVNVEPDADLGHVAFGEHKFIAALTPFVSDSLLDKADLLLPIGTWAESSGTFVNVEGTWQSFGGFANPVGESRPAWKVLRVLGNLVEADGFDYVSSEDVLADAREAVGDAVIPGTVSADTSKTSVNGEDAPSAAIDLPIYSVDALVRRANALQRTQAARRARGDEVLSNGLRARNLGIAVTDGAVPDRFDVQNTDRDRRRDPGGGILDLFRTQGHWRDAGSCGTEPSRPDGAGATVRGCHQAVDQGNHCSEQVEQVPVRHCTAAFIDSCPRDVGRDAIASGLRHRGYQRGSAVRTRAHVGRCLRRYPRGLGHKLEVCTARRHAFGGSDRRLRDCDGLRPGRCPDGRGQPEPG